MEGALIELGPRLRTRLRTNLNAHRRRIVSDPDARAAAVAITVVATPEQTAGFVLTQRSARLNSHARQYALPGGRIDPGETASDAARRELSEEVGLDVTPQSVLGELDDYRTRSGYVITPVVIWAPNGGDLRPHEAEVAAAFVVPLAELERADSPRWLNIDESPKPVIQLPIFDRLIHAPTAAVLWGFRETALHGRSVDLAGVEEPVWAWR